MVTHICRWRYPCLNSLARVRMDWPDALEIVDDAIESQKNNLSDAQINLLSSAWNRIQQG